MTSTTNAQPAQRVVLETAELLENILLHLPTRDLLLAQRTCRQWEKLIDGSIHCQRALFFVAAPDKKDGTLPEPNTLLIDDRGLGSGIFENFKPLEDDDFVKAPPPRGFLVNVSRVGNLGRRYPELSWNHCSHNAGFYHGSGPPTRNTNGETLFSLRSNFVTLSKEAFCKKMLFTQPPVNLLAHVLQFRSTSSGRVHQVEVQQYAYLHKFWGMFNIKEIDCLASFQKRAYRSFPLNTTPAFGEST